MRKPFREFSVLLLCCGLAGCGPRVTNRNLDQVRPDMTTKEVEAILGAPSRIASSPELRTPEVRTLPVTKYLYEQDGKTVTLTFVGDRLADGGKDGAFVK